MSTATAIVPRTVDSRPLLHLVNARLVAIRRALGHDHGDEPFWIAFGQTVRATQRQRIALRDLASYLHTDRATRHGRLHGKQFETLEAQRDWVGVPDLAGLLDRARALGAT